MMLPIPEAIISIQTQPEIIKTANMSPYNVYRRYPDGTWEIMAFDSWEKIENPYLLEQEYKKYKRWEENKKLADNTTL